MHGAAQIERVAARELALDEHMADTLCSHPPQQLVGVGHLLHTTAVGPNRGGQHGRGLGIGGQQHPALGRVRHGLRRRLCFRCCRGAGRCCGGQLDHQAFGRAEHFDAGAGGMPARLRHQRVDAVVVAQRVMVEQRQLAHPPGRGHVDREFSRAVAPADVGLVFGPRELRVVDQQVGAVDEAGELALFGGLRWPLAACQRQRMRLVVGGVDDGRAVGLDAVAQRQRRVVHVVGADAHVVDLERALGQVVVAHPGGELLECDGEVGVLHLAGQRVADRRPHAARAIDVPLELGVEQRCQEGQTLDVVPVGVADEDVAAPRATGFCQQRLAQRVGTGAAIEQDQHATATAHLDAGRVAAVAQGLRPRLRNRPSRAPEADFHGIPPVAKGHGAALCSARWTTEPPYHAGPSVSTPLPPCLFEAAVAGTEARRQPRRRRLVGGPGAFFALAA